MQIVEVEWIDSAHHQGWTARSEWIESLKEKKYSVCRTAGYLLQKTRDSVVIVQSQSDVDHMDAAMVIPRVAVTKITVLKK